MRMNHPTQRTTQSAAHHRRRRRTAGLSLIELVLALAITGMLLTATMVALDASFKAYAAAAEEASTQAQTRMVIHRLNSLIRRSTAHGPVATRHADNPLVSDYITLLEPQRQGQTAKMLTIGYEPDEDDPQKGYIWLAEGWSPTEEDRKPLLTGVTAATFTTTSRQDAEGVWVLHRATVDLTAQPSPDTTLGLERGAGSAIRMIASTMPRTLD